MKPIFYGEFEDLLRTYEHAETKEDKLIQHKLQSIVALYTACGVEERAFVDEIMLEFSRVIALIQNQRKRTTVQLAELQAAQTDSTENGSVVATSQEGRFSYDREVLEAFYDYFKGDYPLSFWQIEGYKFADNAQRKQLVNLTIWDYVNRIKTFANRYLQELYPEDCIPLVVHGERAEEYESFEPIVFIYEHLELIIAKMKTTNEDGETSKQRLNIRSALRKLNDFKQSRMAKV